MEMRKIVAPANDTYLKLELQLRH